MLSGLGVDQFLKFVDDQLHGALGLVAENGAELLVSDSPREVTFDFVDQGPGVDMLEAESL